MERVVALLDEVSLAPEPEPDPRPREEIVLNQRNPSPAVDGWVAFVDSPAGYRLRVNHGPPPSRGAAVELGGVGYRVLRLGPSPLPGDRRRCAYLEQERPAAERTFER